MRCKYWKKCKHYDVDSEICGAGGIYCIDPFSLKHCHYYDRNEEEYQEGLKQLKIGNSVCWEGLGE